MPFRLTSLDDLVKKTDAGSGVALCTEENLGLDPVDKSVTISLSAHANNIADRIAMVIEKINDAQGSRVGGKDGHGLVGSAVTSIYIGVSGVATLEDQVPSRDNKQWLMNRDGTSGKNTVSRWVAFHEKTKVGMVILGVVDDATMQM
jgi:hypothetical protein